MILFCLSGAAGSSAMFWLGLFSSNSSTNEKPAGIITRKNNVVQRRPADRVLWGRLSIDSPVYLGDLILVTESSSATLNIDDNYINLNENTLIRIQRRADNTGQIEINLDEGSLDLISGVQGNIPMINTGGSKVTAQSGTILGIEARKDGGVEVQVIEGSALMEKETGAKELSAGTMIALDASGTERLIPGAMVTQPRPNAQFLKNRPEPFSVDFAWSRINLEQGQTLRLEIAADQNFYRIASSIDGLYETAKAALTAGHWYWRLCFDTAVLASGQLTVAEATGPQLISPPNDTTVLYRDDLPLLRFQWSERKEALSYLLEISRMPDFSDTLISRPVNGVFFVNANLGQGTWYWRVLPVFPNTYNDGGGNFGGAYSSVSTFHLKQQIEAIPKMEVRLLSPDQGARLTGLTALRDQTLFNWEYNGEITQSRFVLSRNSNPLQGQPQIERINPGRSISLNRLEEGNWYWTVEIESPEGHIISQVRQLQVLPIPTLPAPGNRRPVNGQRIGVEELKAQRTIVFSWSAVQGANAYIVTLYQAGSRRRITGSNQPVSRTNWTLDNLSVLDRGNFIWQVEAVNTAGGNIDQRGRPGENSFIIDIPYPKQVHIEKPLILE
jgi:hypothetical protein